jgi:CheY-like chemotaxis protein
MKKDRRINNDNNNCLFKSLKYNELFLLFHDDIIQQKYYNFKLNNVSRFANLLFSGIACIVTTKYVTECIIISQFYTTYSYIVMNCRIIKLLICLLWFVMFSTKYYLKINYQLFANSITILHQTCTWIIYIARLASGKCESGMPSYACNPNYECFGVPLETYVLLLITPFVFQSYFKCIDMRIAATMWILSAAVIIASHLLYNEFEVFNYFFYALTTSFLLLCCSYGFEHTQVKYFIENQTLEYTLKSSMELETKNKLITSEREQINKILGCISHDLRTPSTALTFDIESITNVLGRPQSTADDKSVVLSKIDFQFISSQVQILHDNILNFLRIVNRSLDHYRIDSNVSLSYNPSNIDYKLCVWKAVDYMKSIHGSSASSNIVTMDLTTATSSNAMYMDPLWLLDSVLILLENASQCSSGDITLCMKNVGQHVMVSVSNGSSDVVYVDADRMSVNYNNATELDELKVSVMERTQGGLGADLYVWAHRIKLAGGECGRCVTPPSLFGNTESSNANIKYCFSLPVSSAELITSSDRGVHNKSRLDCVPDSINKKSNNVMEQKLLQQHFFYKNNKNNSHVSGMLIVDDSAVIRKSMKRLLENMGYEIHTADDGKAALALMKEHVYEMVFMDFEMPVMGGIEATQRIREWEAGKHINEGRQYIVGITAGSSKEMCEKGMNAGMNDFLYKPLNVDLVIADLLKRNFVISSFVSTLTKNNATIPLGTTYYI